MTRLYGHWTLAVNTLNAFIFGSLALPLALPLASIRAPDALHLPARPNLSPLVRSPKLPPRAPRLDPSPQRDPTRANTKYVQWSRVIITTTRCHYRPLAVMVTKKRIKIITVTIVTIVIIYIY